MRIHFDTAAGSQSVDNASTAYGKSSVSARDTKGSYQTDISGTVMDNNAYGGHGRTTENVMEQAGQQDVAVQRNYMAVMSNSMSDEDFARLQEKGFHPGQEDVERIVTILDQIKAELLKAGEHITGYTDTIDRETLEQIAGSQGYANAIMESFARYDVPLTEENLEKTVQAEEEAGKLNEPAGSAVKYMVQNRLDPSLQNLYLAQHATNGREKPAGGYYATGTEGYYARKADTIQWDQLEPAMEQVVREAASAARKSSAAEAPTMEEAKWLVEESIELTAENLNRLHEIRSLSYPLQPESVIEASAIAIADGIRPDRMPLYRTETAAQQAAGIQDAVGALSDEAADIAAAQLLEEGRPDGYLNLKAIVNAQTLLDSGYDATALEKNLGARRALEEVRLQMTLEANIKLIKSNYAIDTAPLEELVETLKQAQQEIRDTLFGGTKDSAVTEQAQLYDRTLEKTSWLRQAPAAVIGGIAGTFRETTLEELSGQAEALRSRYEKAEQSYETLMTAPRRDLGDSIRSAFRNVDDILKDLELETTETNRRAVRILGYNSMEITPEHIAQVKAADLSVQDTVQRMTPGAVLAMIRDGKNPLRMSLGELDSYFSGQDTPQQETERYSRFLYRLEQNKEITQEEKTGYIGIYRMLRQLEKNDGQAVGSLVDQGLELTFSNLLAAMRTARKGGVDQKIDDSVGGVSRKETGLPDITEQISTAFRKQLHAVREQLHADMLKQGGFSQDMSLEAFYEMVQEEAASEETGQTEAQWRREAAADCRRMAAVSDAAIEELLAYGQPVSTDSILAAQGLLGKRGGMWRRALNRQEERESEEKLKKLHDSFTSETEAKEAYAGLVDQLQEEIAEQTGESDTQAVDVREKLLLHKQLTYSRQLSQEENYEVPVMVQGRLTSLNLKILHVQDKPSKAAVMMETEETGKIAGEFMIRDGSVSGYLTCESSRAKAYLEKVRGRMEDGLKEQGFSQNRIQVITTGELDLVAFSQKTAEGRQNSGEAPAEHKQSANALYRIARLFLHSV